MQPGLVPYASSTLYPTEPRTLTISATMKFFNIFLTAIFVALLGMVGSVAQTSDQVITAVDSFIIVIRTLDTQVPSLNVINFPTMGFVCPLTPSLVMTSSS